MRRYSCTERFCAQINFTRRRLYTQRFYSKKFYTTKFLYTDALHKDLFTRINKGTQALLHTELFYTEKLLHRTVFTQKKNFYAGKNLTQKVAHTDCTKKFFTHRNFYTQTLPRAAFTQSIFSAQKPWRTAAFMHSSFYADPFTHRCLYTEKLLRTEVSAHSTLLHTASFYTERLCFPFLIAYLSRSPSQVDFACLILIIYGCDLYIRYVEGERERERERCIWLLLLLLHIMCIYIWCALVCIGVRTMRFVSAYIYI